MNKKNYQIGAAAGLLAVIVVATASVVQLRGEAAAQISGDFRNAVTAEVHDAQGQVLMRGSFAAVDTNDKGEIERHATLTPVSPDLKATGEAEVEYQVDKPTEQEVELTVSGLAAGTDIAFVIDGNTVATSKANRRGKVDIELAVNSAP